MKLNPLSYYSKTDHIKNVKKTILLPFFTLFVNCEEQQRNCKDFYTGTFYSETIVDGKKYKCLKRIKHKCVTQKKGDRIGTCMKKTVVKPGLRLKEFETF